MTLWSGGYYRHYLHQFTNLHLLAGRLASTLCNVLYPLGLEKVKMCQTALKQELMTDADMQFLVSYSKVMRPITIAMDLLQGETSTYLAHLLPTIIGIKCKLEQSTDRLVQPLVRALSDGINRRFHAVLTDKEHLIASILHPQFKLNFLQEQEDARLNMKRMVLAYIQEVADECHEAESDASQALLTTGISISSS